MRKQDIDLPVFHVQIDVCDRRNLVWLEIGELALVQLAYEASTRFLDAQEFRRRMQDLEASPERLAEFEDKLTHATSAGSHGRIARFW